MSEETPAQPEDKPAAKPTKARGPKFTESICHAPFNTNPTFTVLVKASGSRVEGLAIEHVHEPEQGDASVVFVTRAGKRWKMRMEEFSFILNGKEVDNSTFLRKQKDGKNNTIQNADTPTETRDATKVA